MKLVAKIFLPFLLTSVITLNAQGSYSITSVQWSNRIDNNGDGYTCSRMLRINVNTSQNTYAEFRLRLIPNVGNPFTYYDTPGGSFIPAGNSYIDLEIGNSSTGGEIAHGIYDIWIDLRAWPTTTSILAQVGPSNTSLHNQKFETSENDNEPLGNPIPTLTEVNPQILTKGQTSDVVFIGTGFMSSSSLSYGIGVFLNSWTVNSSTQITANISISSSASGTTRSFTVSNPSPGGGTSNTVTVTLVEPDNPKPIINDFTINAGAAYSLSRSVVLNNSCMNNPTHYMASEYTDFHDASWQQYSASPSYFLTGSIGKKTIYFKTKNDAGESDLFGIDDIQLESYEISGVTRNGLYPQTISGKSAVVDVAPGDVIQFIGSSNAPNTEFRSYLEDPLSLRCGGYDLQTDNSGVFYYPKNYIEAMATHVIPQAGSYLFIFENGTRILLNSRDLSTLVKYPIADLTMIIRDIGQKIESGQMVTDPDVFEYTRWNQNVISGQSMSQFDMQAVERGRQKILQYAHDDFIISKLEFANEVIVYGVETTGCIGGGAAVPATAGVSEPVAQAFCVTLLAHIVSDVGVAWIDELERKGILTSGQANFLRGSTELSYGIFSFMEIGNPYKLFDVGEFLHTFYTGGVELLNADLETESDGTQSLVTNWNYSNSNVTLIMNGRQSVSIKDNSILPTNFEFPPNYPNPFNPSTTIQFSLPKATDVRLRVYDVLGREIADLASGKMNAGRYTKRWNASDVESGIYFCKLQAGSFTKTRMLVLVK